MADPGAYIICIAAFPLAAVIFVGVVVVIDIVREVTCRDSRS